MHRIAATLIIALAAVAPLAQAQDVELYEEQRFAGMRLSLVQDIPDLAAYAFAGRVSSVVIHRGRWEFCTQANFRGNCVTVGPGSYAELPSGLQGSIVSLRSLRGTGAGVPGAPGTSPIPGVPPAPLPGFYPPGTPPPQVHRPGPGERPPWGLRGEAVLLYASSDLSGEPVAVSEATGNLNERRFNDAARSVEILRGRWQLCQHADYSGECQVFGPGRYALQGRLAGGLTSLRPVTGNDNRPLPVWGGVVLYEHSDSQGRQLALGDTTPDLGQQDFNDRVSSIEVISGQWEFCTDVQFRGQCFVLGPGRHNLDRSVNDRISSLRPLRRR